MEVNKKNMQYTPLGPVPADWIAGCFEEFITGFSSGSTPSRARPAYFKGSIPWITSGELNYNRITGSLEKISEQALADTGLKIIPEGTFLMAITGLEAQGTRGSCAVTAIKATTNQSCMALFPQKSLLNDYLYHFYVRFGDRLALSYCQGTKQQSYTAAIVKKLPIFMPPSLKEQEAVARILSDTDSLIEALQKLRIKKNSVRTATMQALLSAKKRLPGFSKPWVHKKLGNICRSITTGKLDANAMVPAGAYRFYTCAKEFYYIDHYAFDTEALLVSGNGSNLGYIHYYKGKFNAYQRTYVLSGFNQNIRFIKAAMDIHLKNRIASQVNAGNTPYIRRDTLAQMSIHIPSDPKEQQAIAAIINDMDEEIQALDLKIQKYSSLKKAISHNLLTGKIRI